MTDDLILDIAYTALDWYDGEVLDRLLDLTLEQQMDIHNSLIAEVHKTLALREETLTLVPSRVDYKPEDFDEDGTVLVAELNEGQWHSPDTGEVLNANG